MMKKDQQLLRLRKILQRLKSQILQELSDEEREQAKKYLQQLDENYSNSEIKIDEYKIKSMVFLCKYWHDISRTEQFLYRETGNFLTQAEKFEICELAATALSQKMRE